MKPLVVFNSIDQWSATFWQARATRWQNKLKAGRNCDINLRFYLIPTYNWSYPIETQKTPLKLLKYREFLQIIPATTILFIYF